MARIKKILIVDDEPLARDLLSRRLTDYGYVVSCAASEKDVLELLREDKEIDLVILDILMPRSSGLDVAEAIKRDFPFVKIIIASVFPQDEQKFLIDCADGYYDKSDNFARLTDSIDRMLKAEIRTSGD